MNWETLILFIAPVLAGLLAIKINTHNKRIIELVLTFSGAYLFSLSIIHLLPDLFYHEEKSIYFTLGIFILGGFFLQLFLDFFSQGVEHGHIHVHDTPSFLPSVLFGLSMHSLIEGIPLGLDAHIIDHGDHVHHDHSLLYGIIIHKIPAAFILGLLLNRLNINAIMKILFIVLFASMTPIGSMLASILNELNLDWTSYIMALVVGSFFHISTTILFESSTKAHKFGKYKILTIILGFGLALLTQNAH